MSAETAGTAGTAQALIPGAYEQRPVRPRQLGTMSGPAFGSPDSTAGAPLDAVLIAARQREGGGAPSQRRPARGHGDRS